MATPSLTPVERIRRARATHGFAILLLSQFALVAIYPLAQTARPTPGLFGAFAMVVFLVGLWCVVEEPRIRVLGVALCIPAASNGLLTKLGFNGFPIVVAAGFTMLFLAFVAGVLLWKILTASSVNTEILYGAVSVYLFIGLLWGTAYSLVEQMAPGSLRLTYGAARPLAWHDFTFFSFVTLTTIGYGDIVPVGGVRSLVMLEGIIGVMYPPVMIGRLLTLYSQGRANS